MTKKDFIALADFYRNYPIFFREDDSPKKFVISFLADFCQSQNPAFKRDRFIAYALDKAGPNGGKRK